MCDPEYFVDIPEKIIILEKTEKCVECRKYFTAGRVGYHGTNIRAADEGHEQHVSSYFLCEQCGDLVVSLLAKGLCWKRGKAKADLAKHNRLVNARV